MADGIKIRALNTTSTVRKADVLIIDKLNTITNENITYQIKVNDFATGLFVSNDLNTLENLYNVNINNPQLGDVLYYDGDSWINKKPDATSGEFSGDALIFNTSDEPVVFKVVVGDKSDHHRFRAADPASTKAYQIDGVEAPVLMLAPNRRYRFDQSDASNLSYDLRFYSGPTHKSLTGSTPYSSPTLDDVTVVGTAGQDGAYTELFITQRYEVDSFGNPILMEETPITLFYNCLSSAGDDFMGNAIKNVGSIENTEFGIGGGSGSGGGILPVMNQNITELQTKVQELQDHLSRLIEIE